MMCPKCLNDGGLPGKYCFYCGTFLKEEEESIAPAYSYGEGSESVDTSEWFKAADDLMGENHEAKAENQAVTVPCEPERMFPEDVNREERMPQGVAADKSKKRKILICSVIAVVIVCLGVLAGFLLAGGSSPKEQEGAPDFNLEVLENSAHTQM